MEIDFKLASLVDLRTSPLSLCIYIYTECERKLCRMSRRWKRAVLRQLRCCEARCTPKRFVESAFGTPFKFDTPDLGKDRDAVRIEAFHASRGYTAASSPLDHLLLEPEGIERIHACSHCASHRGKKMGREEGWKSVNARSSVLRYSVNFAENA